MSGESDGKVILPTGDGWKYRRLQFYGPMGLFGPQLSALSDGERAVYLDIDYLARCSEDGCSLHVTLPSPTDDELQAIRRELLARGRNRNVRTYRRAFEKFAAAGLLIPQSSAKVSGKFHETIGISALALLQKELQNHAHFSELGKRGKDKQRNAEAANVQPQPEAPPPGRDAGRELRNAPRPQDIQDPQDSLQEPSGDSGTLPPGATGGSTSSGASSNPSSRTPEGCLTTGNDGGGNGSGKRTTFHAARDRMLAQGEAARKAAEKEAKKPALVLWVEDQLCIALPGIWEACKGEGAYKIASCINRFGEGRFNRAVNDAKETTKRIDDLTGYLIARMKKYAAADKEQKAAAV